MLTWKFGSYSHATGEITLAHNLVPIKGSNGETVLITHTFNIQGILHGDDIADLTTKLGLMRNAYLTQSAPSFGLVDASNNNVPTHHYLDANVIKGSVRVKNLPSFPKGEGGEYTTYRSYNITIEADEKVGSEEDQQLVSFNETLVIIGDGGPLHNVTVPLEGPPIRQDITETSDVSAIQTGRAVAKDTYPGFPAFLFPEHVLHRQVNKSFIGATLENGSLGDYGVSWSYPFLSPEPLIGVPNVGA